LVIRAVCTYVPRELLEAFGLEAPRLIPPGTVASESRGEARSGAGACAWCKSALGSEEDAGALWIGGATCDQMRRTLELAGRASAAGSLIIGVPKTRTAEAEALYAEELRWLASELGRRTGRKLESGPLRCAIEARDDIRARMRLARTRLSGADFAALVQREETLSAEKMIDFLEHYIIPAPRKPDIPVLVAGSPIAPAELGWLRLLEDTGLSVVADATCTGDRAIDFTVGIMGADEPLEALTRAYFRRPPCVFVRPNDEFYAYASRLAEERGVRAVVWRSMRGCDIHALEAPRAARMLGRPLLALDMSYGDSDSPRIRTRVEAFAESLR
jgi:benzoyl-CoA reductase/2-hydroxyglutaryl-CoA dehydratase subunit BcrC/BadD/HgdB